ncbi:Uncharacterized protein FWK35_00010190, partial [Aphis craccivora]
FSTCRLQNNKRYSEITSFKSNFDPSYQKLNFAGILQGRILFSLLFNTYTSVQPTSQSTIVADFNDNKTNISIDKNIFSLAENLQTHFTLKSEWYIKCHIKPIPN